MTSTTNLTPAQIDAAVGRAHQLRSEAFRELFVTLFGRKRQTKAVGTAPVGPITPLKA